MNSNKSEIYGFTRFQLHMYAVKITEPFHVHNLVKYPLLQGWAYSGWRPEIWSGPENQPGAYAPTKMA